MIREWPVQQGLYQALTGDAPLMATITGVFDKPDSEQAFPYVTLGESTGANEDLLNESGGNHTQTLQVWDSTDYPVSRVKQILGRMNEVLHNAKIAISGTQTVACVVENTNTFREVDVNRGVMRVRVVTFG
jgi:hypothetical protein